MMKNVGVPRTPNSPAAAVAAEIRSILRSSARQASGSSAPATVSAFDFFSARGPELDIPSIAGALVALERDELLERVARPLPLLLFPNFFWGWLTG